MALIQLTTEELRTSAQKYTNGAEEVREVLRTLSNEQEIIRENWKGAAFRALINSLQNYLQKLKSLRLYLMQSMRNCIKLLKSLSKTTKNLHHKFINLL